MKSDMCNFWKGILLISMVASVAYAQAPEAFWYVAPSTFSRDAGKTPGSQYNPS
jgi:hypothetical protein